MRTGAVKPCPLADQLSGLPDLMVRTGVLLNRLTTLRIGGPADILVTPQTLEGLATLRAHLTEADETVLVLGNGSNLLVADAGFEGVVVRVSGTLGGMALVEPGVLEIGAGSPWGSILREAARAGWAGLEFGAGIPGTWGGAVATNAGTRAGQTSDVLISVTGVDREGAVRTLPARDLSMAYRECRLPDGFIIASGRVAVEEDDPERVGAAIEELWARRRRDQPDRARSAGCMFKNPPGESAGRLIDQAGLKGATEGGACVSREHGNFLINRNGEATASDVLRLIERIRERVVAVHGVELELEVKLVGVT
ncbi:MAG: UDP-N-acetylmuramate dehydrogenase [Gemmatimonadota bacterium]|nr:UDP-N-acetylmuramate dehydrogenase [Gemmatimonadota bacterium]